MSDRHRRPRAAPTVTLLPMLLMLVIITLSSVGVTAQAATGALEECTVSGACTACPRTEQAFDYCLATGYRQPMTCLNATSLETVHVFAQCLPNETGSVLVMEGVLMLLLVLAGALMVARKRRNAAQFLRQMRASSSER